jgi:hypothetical protein
MTGVARRDRSHLRLVSETTEDQLLVPRRHREWINRLSPAQENALCDSLDLISAGVRPDVAVRWFRMRLRKLM